METILTSAKKNQIWIPIVNRGQQPIWIEKETGIASVSSSYELIDLLSLEV